MDRYGEKGDANQQGSYHSKVQGIHGPSWKLTFDNWLVQ